MNKFYAAAFWFLIGMVVGLFGGTALDAKTTDVPTVQWEKCFSYVGNWGYYIQIAPGMDGKMYWRTAPLPVQDRTVNLSDLVREPEEQTAVIGETDETQP